ncbi:MAG: ATP-binding protein [Bacteroidia bacterium]
MVESVDSLLEKISLLEREKKSLLDKLAKVEEASKAMKDGNVDAYYVGENKTAKVFTTDSPDQTYRLFIEKMSEGAVTLNTEGLILYSNMRFSSMMKAPLEKIIGSDFDYDIPTKCMKKFGQLLKLSSEKDAKGEIFMSDSEKNLIPVELSLTRLQMQDSIALSIVITDLTKHREEEKELKMKNQLLKAANAELANFAYIASHDLQEPLRTIVNYVDLFQKKYSEKLDKKSDEYLRYISEATVRMRTLINDLLEYSRIGRLDSEIASIDCNKLLQTVLRDLSVAIKESNSKIKVEKLPVIIGYPTEMKSLFQNLISNAIKFRKPDKDTIVTVTAQAKDNDWLFAVKDNGIGMDKKYHNRIFTIFQRLHTQKEYPGTGIGLAQSKKIVELHKGKIWVESEPGQGSTFYFTIPKTPVK